MIAITGSAGFIGFHLAKRLLEEGQTVIGIDNINDYYSPQLKQDRLKILHEHDTFHFYKTDLCDRQGLEAIFNKHSIKSCVNLAAQAGVRYSLINPKAYIDTNINGFFNICELSKIHEIEHFVYASSSSVYGLNTNMPFSTHDNVDHPLSLYAATKKSNELMAHTFSYLYNLPTTGLRFFTVYGPWGRPDMALFLFTKAILEDKPINVFNYGKMERDFTYIDDIVEGVVRVIASPAKPDPDWNGDDPTPNSSPFPYKIYNIGNNNSVTLDYFISCIEDALNKKAHRSLLPIQPGDVPATFADIDDLQHDFGFKPNTDIKDGINHFIQWYTEYFQI